MRAVGGGVGLIEWYLGVRIRLADGDLPETVAFALPAESFDTPGAYERLESVLAVAFAHDARQVVVSVAAAESAIASLERKFERVDAPRELTVRTPEESDPADTPVQVTLGLGGRAEFAEAVESLAEGVEDGELSASTLEATDLEQRLAVPVEPDLLVKLGERRLPNTLLWQSAYTEYHFTGGDWSSFDRRSYLRALRDYQTRQRRFGE